MRLHLTALGLLILLSTPAQKSSDWPQWRGPAGSGTSRTGGLPSRWSDSDGIAWQAPLAGRGTSSPIVTADLVIVTSQIGIAPTRDGSHPRLARDDGALARLEAPIGGNRSDSTDEVALVIEAFRLADGRRLWEFRSEAVGPFPELHEKHNLATPTPVTDGRLIYAWFGNGQVFAVDLEGRLVWTRHLGTDYRPFDNQWGHGSSPVLHEERLILLCDHTSGAYLVALSKRDGRQIWKTERGQGRISHSTPLVVAAEGGDELIVNSSERIDAYDPTTGRLLWHAGSPRQTPIPSPVFHEGIVYMTRGYRNSDFLALRPGGRGDVTATHILWRTAGGGSYVPSLVHYEGLLYLTNEVGVVTCAEATSGERVWRMRLGGVFFASPVAADNKVFLLSETGETFVLRAGRSAGLLGRNRLPGRFIASPAIAAGSLLLRSDNRLFSVGR